MAYKRQCIPLSGNKDFLYQAFWALVPGLAYLSVILLASFTKIRQYCDTDKMLQKATTKNTYIYKLGHLELGYITDFIGEVSQLLKMIDELNQRIDNLGQDGMGRK